MITVFDLDGVLSRADTMATLIIARLRTRPWLALPVGVLAAVAAPATAEGELRPRCNRAIVHLALRGMSEDEYRRLARRTARRLASRPDNTTAEIVDAARAASAAGTCLVTTATERFLAERFLAEIGVSGAEVHASEFVFSHAGPSFRSHNVGRRKALAYRAAHPTGRLGRFFTDSASDLPLAELAQDVVLVGPSRRSVTAFEYAGIRFRRLG
ncbi:HAD family hydrolase [Microbacterium sp. LWH11-1.2]|uniref:HAD family hydrolase n=1 Tax=Microbacterium sp. LWH11-1.2 TaxID=3135258 RepID=UPI003138D16F